MQAEKFLVLIFLMALTCFAVDSDVTPVWKENGSENLSPWRGEFKIAADSLALFSRRGAIHGEKGIDLTGPIKEWIFLRSQFPFRSDFWSRFYLRLDLTQNRVSPPVKSTTNLLTINFFDRVQKDQPGETVVFELWPDNETFSLHCRLHRTAFREQDLVIQTPLETGIAHCIETHLRFVSVDSLVFSLFMDDSLIWQARCQYVFQKDFIGCHVMTDPMTGDSNRFSVSLDDIAFSNKRLYPLPLLPDTCACTVSGYTATLWCNSRHLKKRNDKVSAVRYELISGKYPQLPIYDVSIRDPQQFWTHLVPFELDSGLYSWRVNVENQFGNRSGWGRWDSFLIDKKRPVKIALFSPWISDAGSRNKLERVNPGKWYDMHLDYTRLDPEARFGFFLFWLHHDTYSEGNIINKGGRFLSEKNYVFNIGVDTGGIVRLYEKTRDSSTQSLALPPNTLGLYMDFRQGNVVLDSLSNEVKLRFRLLSNALPGKWFLNGYMVVCDRRTGEEQLSNFVASTIRVNEVKAWAKIQSFLLLILIGGLLSGFIIMFSTRTRREKKEKLNNRKDENPIRAFIEANIQKKLTVQDALDGMKLSKGSFRNLLKDNGIELFPEYVNEIKVRKAKELLMGTDKNISEIGFMLGYDDANYFIRIFKKLVGCTPKDFRLNQTNGRGNK